jgi:hypothetical protein
MTHDLTDKGMAEMELVEMLARDICSARGENPDRVEGGSYDRVTAYGNQTYDQTDDPATAKLIDRTAMSHKLESVTFARWEMYRHHASALIAAGWGKADRIRDAAYERCAEVADTLGEADLSITSIGRGVDEPYNSGFHRGAKITANRIRSLSKPLEKENG